MDANAETEGRVGGPVGYVTTRSASRAFLRPAPRNGPVEQWSGEAQESTPAYSGARGRDTRARDALEWSVEGDAHAGPEGSAGCPTPYGPTL